MLFRSDCADWDTAPPARDLLDRLRALSTHQIFWGGNYFNLPPSQCFLIWDFHFRFKRFDTATEQTIRGASHLLFNAQGLVSLHRDYWDAAEELYEKLPLLGSLMRALKRLANR